MSKWFSGQITKMTSLLMATVFFLCSAGTQSPVSAENAGTEAPQASKAAHTEAPQSSPLHYAIPEISPSAVTPQPAERESADMVQEPAYQPQEVYSDAYTAPNGAEPGEPQTEETPQITAEAPALETITPEPVYTAEPSVQLSAEVTEAPDREEPIALFAADPYVLTDADRTEYETKSDYTINNVRDWLKVEALSREFNFENKYVYIATPDDSTLAGKHILTGTGFTGIGCEEHPFAGTLITSLSGTSVNCDCPLVAYMSSKATVERLVLGMSGGNAGIAGTLIFEGDSDQTMLLKGITVTGYLEDDTSEATGGLFGKVVNSTEHKFTIDAAKVTESETDNWGGINMEFAEHNNVAAVKGKSVGTFIGKIIGNVTFKVNSDFHISVPSLYGSEATGGIVGYMEYYPYNMNSLMYSSQLASLMNAEQDASTYPTLHFSQWSGFSVKNIHGTGYNGGIIGYADHANIMNDTENSVLEIKNADIEGGKAAGGFIGFAAYTTINGTGMGEIMVNNSTITSNIATNSKIDSIAGGFIGIYGDGNNFFNKIKITVKDMVFTTAEASGGSVQRYMGGFVGQYDSKDDIVITPESDGVEISNVRFIITAGGTHCGGFVSYITEHAGNLDIDTKLSINGVYQYVPSDSRYNNVSESFGGISSVIKSKRLSIKNITMTDVQTNIGKYIGVVAGRISCENSVFENLNISGFIMKSKLTIGDVVTRDVSGSSYRYSHGAGSVAGRIDNNTELKNISVTNSEINAYIASNISDDGSYASQYGVGGLIGVLGNGSGYTFSSINGASYGGTIVLSHYYNSRTYGGGLVGYVYRKTALELDGAFDFSLMKTFSSGCSFVGRLIGAQRDALIYMQPTASFTYSSVFDNMDEVGNCGGVYRNETFWDDPSVSEASVSDTDGTMIIERDNTAEAKVKVNGTVQTYDGGWGLSTMGDYMRFSIVNNSGGFYGLEAFGGAELADMLSGTYTALNDIDLSARYMGVLSLTRNDTFYDNVYGSYSNYNYCKYLFRGTFKGKEGADVRITLPGFPIYMQTNTGLFSTAIGATFKDLTITGTLETSQNPAQPYPGFRAHGALVANAFNDLTVENVTCDGVTVNEYEQISTERYVGILVGNINYFTRTSDYTEGYDHNPYNTWTVNIKDVSIKNSVVNSTGRNNGIFTGGLIGFIWYKDANTQMNVNLDNVIMQDLTMTNESVSDSRMAGLISRAYAVDLHKINCSFNDVKLNGVTITTPAGSAVGGLWGYNWNHADVTVTYDRYKEEACIDGCAMNMTSTGRGTVFGGLLYIYEYAFMNMKNGFKINDTHLSAPSSTSSYCSFLVSNANNAMIFLTDYRLTNSSVAYGGTIFDEVAGQTKNGVAETNTTYGGMGIVSLTDTETPYSLRKEDFHTYNYQADYSACPNLITPYHNIYTRYYYNLDELVETVKAEPMQIMQISYKDTDFYAFNIAAPEQLVIWHLLMTVSSNNGSSTSPSGNLTMAKYFSECIDTGGTNRNASNTSQMKACSLQIDGEINLTGMSFYPSYVSADPTLRSGHIMVGRHRDTAPGTDKVIFDYDNINQCTNAALAAGQRCIPLRSGSATNGYYASSQHYRIHSGMFGSNTFINAVCGVAFGGSAGTMKYDANVEYSGAVFCGQLADSSVEAQFTDITFDGFYIVNPYEDYSDDGKDSGSLESWGNYYGLMIGGWTSSNNICNFDTIVTKNYGSFVSAYPNKKVAAALIGRAGINTVTGLKKFEFKNMSIADAEETSVLTANGTTLEGIHATAEDQIMAYASYIYSYQYQSAEQGFYNFDDVDYFYGNGQFNAASGNSYYITLGKELGTSGETKTEYYNTSSKVGEESYDEVKSEDNSDYIQFTRSAADNYWLDFSHLNYKPYVYNYESRNINVNYKSGNLLVGCGTYEDPYIITNERQLYSLYCYLAGGGMRNTSTGIGSATQAYASEKARYPQYNNNYKTMLNEWTVNIPGKDDTFCTGEHESLVYNYEEHPVTGFDDVNYATPQPGVVDTRKVGYNSRISVNILRNAYYKITSDIDMSGYDDFYGLCHFDVKQSYGIAESARFPFTGVIIGEKPDGSAPVIKMPNFKKFTGTYNDMFNYLNGYGFIAAAKGCVVKNLTISYPEDGYAKIGNNNSSRGAYVFGGIIGVIWGGDNIIDDVAVTGSVMTNINSFSSGTRVLQYLGGMVGNLKAGNLIMRNFSTADFADFNFTVPGATNNVTSTCKPDVTLTGELSDKKAEYGFINGTIAKVDNANIIVESVDEPEKATDKDGDPLYKLDDTKAVIDFSEYDQNTTNALYASQTKGFLNGKYIEDAGRIRVNRSGYDFNIDLENAKQMEVLAATIGSGGFAMSCRDNSTYYEKQRYKYIAGNDLAHVYSGASSSLVGPISPYDIYSRCRKAAYDGVGSCTADYEDYQFAKKYDNINTGEFYETDYTKLKSDSYKNYIAYNYLFHKYYDFYTDNKKDEFWIIRRGGTYDRPTVGNNAYMCNIINCYNRFLNHSELGDTTINLKADTEYDMTPFKGAFHGIGYAYSNGDAGVTVSNNCTFNGNMYGNGASIILDITSRAALSYSGLFTYLYPNDRISAISYNKETVPIRVIRDLNLTGNVEAVASRYMDTSNNVGMLCGMTGRGRYEIENITVNDAYVGGYNNCGGVIGYVEYTQVVADNWKLDGLKLTNLPYNHKNVMYTGSNLGGMIGQFRPDISNTYINNSYMTNTDVNDVVIDSYYSSDIGGVFGEVSSNHSKIYDTTVNNVTLNQKDDRAFNSGGFAGQMSGSSCDILNTEITDIKSNAAGYDTQAKFGGFVGRLSSIDLLSCSNVNISGIEYDMGRTNNNNSTSYGSTGAMVGGFSAELSSSNVNIDGIFIDDFKAKDSRFIENNVVQNAKGEYTTVNTSATQSIQYSGGIAAYWTGSGSYSRNLRVVSLDDDKISATATPMPTVHPMYTGDNYTRPTAKPNPNRGKRNSIRNSDFYGRYTGAVIGYANYNSASNYNANTGVSNYNNIDTLIEDMDISDNKIIGCRIYKSGSQKTNNNFINDNNYDVGAGGMFGYIYRYYRNNLYANNITIEHNVIGTLNHINSRTVAGGVYGRMIEGNNTDANSGWSNYLYNTVLKNNYIGALDMISESEYYTTVNRNLAYGMMKTQTETINRINNSTIDEVGAYARLYTDGAVKENSEWDYSVTAPGTGDWYAQDNLYHYTQNIGTFIGYNSQNGKRKFRVFFVAPKIIYDNTEYSYKMRDGTVKTSKASARRPATDVGTTAALTDSGNMYNYRSYTHIIYDDANVPVKYGEWDSGVAENVVPEGLGYADNNDYLFAQLKNIYTDYTTQVSAGYIDSADYDETAHVYKLKDNYGQDENGYTMNEVYDYVYYGYERNADGTPISDEVDYLSPYKDASGKTIPMLVYKAQYGTPDTLVNTIINILTNNSGAYNTNVGCFMQGAPPILNVESWKMQLKNGVASPVYNEDGTHKQGGFSVKYTDGDPDPAPSPSTVPKPQRRTFALEHTSYDDSKDAKNGTFTVLHITYGWDNSNMKISGNSIKSTSVMTLDIPVYVSKLLEVQINMRTLDGVQLSNDNMSRHGSESGVVVLKTTNTVMAEYVYDYPRTQYDSVYLKKKLTFETSPGYVYLYKDTKLTLIDVTDNNKEYYYYVRNTMANPEIKFEEFVDAYGEHYKTRDLSDTDAYPKLGTENDPYTDLRGQTWGGTAEDENYISSYGVGVERFIIIIDKSATAIDASSESQFTYHSVCVRVDDEETAPELMKRIRYDGKDHKSTPLNTPTEEYPNPDWYGGTVDGYTAYNYVMIREIDDARVTLPTGAQSVFDGVAEEYLGIGPGKVIKATIDYSITASAIFWGETSKSATDQYLDFIISVQSDGKYVSLPVGTKYSFDGNVWYTIGREGEYQYGKRQIYYYEDRAELYSDYDSDSYKLLINKLTRNQNGKFDVYFDFRDCPENSFSDGNYYINVDAYKTTRREYPASGDYQDTWTSDIYAVYNSGNIGLALQEDDLLYRGINRYLPKVSDNGNIGFKVQLDFRKYLDEETGRIKDVVANQYYSLGFEISKKDASGQYREYNDVENRFKIYYDKPVYSAETGEYVFDGTVDEGDPLAWGHDDTSGKDMRGVSYKFTDEQLNASQGIEGVTELAFNLKYNTDDLNAEDFSNYKFTAYLYLSENAVTTEEMAEGSAASLDAGEILTAEGSTADPLSDYLIFTLARLKTN